MAEHIESPFCVEGQRALVTAASSGPGRRFALPYAILKAGLFQATKAMARELARCQIRVNAILPD